MLLQREGVLLVGSSVRKIRKMGKGEHCIRVKTLAFLIAEKRETDN